MEIGTAFCRWRSTEQGSASSAPLKDFAAKISLGGSGGIRKRERVWLARCVTLARPVVEGKEVSPDKGQKKLHFRGSRQGKHTPAMLLKRRRGKQGPRPKLALLRETFWDFWFVDIRRSIKGRLPRKVMLMKARAVASQLTREMAMRKSFVAVPSIDRIWLERWQRDYGVVLRQPNRRYKCSREVLLLRIVTCGSMSSGCARWLCRCLAKILTFMASTRSPYT